MTACFTADGLLISSALNRSFTARFERKLIRMNVPIHRAAAGVLSLALLVGMLLLARKPADPLAPRASPHPPDGAKVTEEIPVLPPPPPSEPLSIRESNHAVAAVASADHWAHELGALKTLARHDPTAALARVAELATKEERDEALMAVCYQIAERDPALALGAAWRSQQREVESPADGLAFGYLARKWAEQDLSSALDWAAKLAVSEYDTRRDRVVKSLAEVCARTAPEDAARLVVEAMQPGPWQTQTMTAVLDEWARQDYRSARGWAERHPEGHLRETALASLARFAAAP